MLSLFIVRSERILITLKVVACIWAAAAAVAEENDTRRKTKPLSINKAHNEAHLLCALRFALCTRVFESNEKKNTHRNIRRIYKRFNFAFAQ